MRINKKIRLEDFIRVAREKEKIEIPKEAKISVEKARKFLEKVEEEEKPIYGVNTGVGYLAEKRIPKEKLKKLQENIIKSHAVGTGEPLPKEIVRGAMFLKIHTALQGHSGFRIETVEFLKELLNMDIIPFVPEKGSVGASGDLAPMAFIGLAMLGNGKVFYKDKLEETQNVFKRENLKPIKFDTKEGIALINGTQVETSILALSAFDLSTILDAADIACAITTIALLGDKQPFDERIHNLKPFKGQKRTAKIIAFLLESSNYTPKKVQDPYCIRCAPQVHGGVREFLEYIKNVVETEFNSVTDNPLLFPSENTVLKGGNFHGATVGYAADCLSLITTDLSSISERRIAKLLDPKTNQGLPPFLVKNSGLNSGFMITQVLAASLVSENKTLAFPASVDSIPTSAEQEDHVSMGYGAALKARRIVENTARVIAIELMVGAQGLELRFKKAIPSSIAPFFWSIRECSDFLEKDRELQKDIENLTNLVLSGKLGRMLKEMIRHKG